MILHSKYLRLLKAQSGFVQLERKPLLQRILADSQLNKIPKWARQRGWSESN